MTRVRIVGAAWPAPSRYPRSARTDSCAARCSFNPTLVDHFCFQGSHFSQPAQVALGLTKFGGQERLQDVPGSVRSDRATAHANDVHVVVLDALARGKVVAHQSGAYSRDFI